MIRCSVVIPTSDRPTSLEGAMNALARQDMPPDEYEIIVCDGTMRDDTRALVDHWRAVHPVPVTYVQVPTPQRGPAALRNAGARAARGEVLAFTDGDAIPEPDWLRQGWLALSDDAADAASGRIDVHATDEASDNGLNSTQLELPGLTANCFCRRRVFECVGGFDTAGRATSPDGDLFTKLTDRGFDVVHAGDAVVVHTAHPAPRGRSYHRLAMIIQFGTKVAAAALRRGVRAIR